MYVRFLSGRRKGEVEEMKFLDAKAVIADGRAEDAYAEPTAAAAPAPAAQPMKKTGRKK